MFESRSIISSILYSIFPWRCSVIVSMDVLMEAIWKCISRISSLSQSMSDFLIVVRARFEGRWSWGDLERFRLDVNFTVYKPFRIIYVEKLKYYLVIPFSTGARHVNNIFLTKAFPQAWIQRGWRRRRRLWVEVEAKGTRKIVDTVIMDTRIILNLYDKFVSKY